MLHRTAVRGVGGRRLLSTRAPTGVAPPVHQKVYDSSEAALHDLKDGQSM